MPAGTKRENPKNAQRDLGNMRAANTLLLAAIFLRGLIATGHAQPQAQPQSNPLMQLMLSQPPIDVNSPVVVSAAFDPPAVRPGQKAIYRITLNAIASNVRMPGKIPGPPQLDFRIGAQGQVLRAMGNSLQPLTAINYEV